MSAQSKLPRSIWGFPTLKCFWLFFPATSDQKTEIAMTMPRPLFWICSDSRVSHLHASNQKPLISHSLPQAFSRKDLQWYEVAKKCFHPGRHLNTASIFGWTWRSKFSILLIYSYRVCESPCCLSFKFSWRQIRQIASCFTDMISNIVRSVSHIARWWRKRSLGQSLDIFAFRECNLTPHLLQNWICAVSATRRWNNVRKICQKGLEMARTHPPLLHQRSLLGHGLKPIERIERFERADRVRSRQVL